MKEKGEPPDVIATARERFRNDENFGTEIVRAFDADEFNRLRQVQRHKARKMVPSPTPLLRPAPVTQSPTTGVADRLNIITMSRTTDAVVEDLKQALSRQLALTAVQTDRADAAEANLARQKANMMAAMLTASALILTIETQRVRIEKLAAMNLEIQAKLCAYQPELADIAVRVVSGELVKPTISATKSKTDKAGSGKHKLARVSVRKPKVTLIAAKTRVPSDQAKSEQKIKRGRRGAKRTRTPASFSNESVFSNEALKIGHFIRGLRAQLDLSQRDFGAKIGVGITQISLWENNREPIPKARVDAIVRTFGVTRAALGIKDIN